MELELNPDWLCHFPDKEISGNPKLEMLFSKHGDNINPWVVYLFAKFGKLKYPVLDKLISTIGCYVNPILDIVIFMFFQSWIQICARFGICLNPLSIFLDKPNLGKLHFFQIWILLENQEISRWKPSKINVGVLIFFPVILVVVVLPLCCIEWDLVIKAWFSGKRLP